MGGKYQRTCYVQSYKFCIFFNEPMERGILEVNSLLAKSKKSNFFIEPREGGILPPNEFDCKALIVTTKI